ncbi:MAG: sensor histidine kinase, partial [Chitinophagales bacterium]
INLNLAKIYIKSNRLDLAKIYSNQCKESLHEIIRKETVLVDLEIVLKQVKNYGEISTRQKILIGDLVNKSLKITEETEAIENILGNYSLIADAYLVIENFKQANIMLTRRNMLFKQLTEQQKIDSYKQIRESHELELQKKELEKKEQLLQQKETLNKKQKQINTELELFASMASYDLKAPIRTILALCSIIKNQNLAKTEMNEYLTLIKIDAQKMNNLINSLLKYAKIGYKNVEFKKIALKTTVNTVKRNLATEIKNKNAIISLEKLPEINGNKALLEQLFQNLINNALIYNENQKPEITIRSTKNQNEIEIVDNGIGIPKNRINQIFKAFTRAHSASKYEGSGVGLAICKKIMDIHFGSISVSSEQGKGTCFTLTFK